ncbi:hypothetical protein D030_0381B, partial [Vibrio parahaemolyticus AQ3810]
IRH